MSLHIPGVRNVVGRAAAPGHSAFDYVTRRPLDPLVDSFDRPTATH
jgi:hypothetical protein